MTPSEQTQRPAATSPSEEIRAIRATTGLSQQAFGDLYGIPKRTIQNWESGIREPAPYIINLLRIATSIDQTKLF